MQNGFNLTAVMGIYRNNRFLILLLILVLIAYIPVSLHLFSLKNDDLIYFLPYRYRVSEAIQQGHFPWWNPFIYTGIPLHSDIQSGVWNPVVMMLSLFGTYNMSMLETELLIYLLIASVGMFKLCREMGFGKEAALIAGISYGCCGFITDSSSIIAWVASAAYLPICFLYFYRLLKNPAAGTAIKLALSMALLLTAGYPSFFIFCVYILIAGLIVFGVKERSNGQLLKKVLLQTFFSAALFIVISSPAWLSWMDFFPYYSRGEGTNSSYAAINSFPIFSSLSFLFPSSVALPHPRIETDLVARNASVGIVLFCFFFISFRIKDFALKHFLLFILTFSFLFSLGSFTPIHELCFRFLPLMNTFRHPATMRVFTSIGLIILAAAAINQAIEKPKEGFYNAKPFILGLMALILVIMISYLPQVRIFKYSGSVTSIYKQAAFADLLFIQGIIQLVFLSFLLFPWTVKRLLTISIINIIVLCWMALPFTVISKVKTPAINNYVHSFIVTNKNPDINLPIGIRGASGEMGPFGYPAFYDNRISIQDEILSPTITKDYLTYLSDTSLRKLTSELPVFYTLNSSGLSRTELLSFSNNHFEIKVNNLESSPIYLFQQYHHHWKLYADKTEIPLTKANTAFMKAELPEGTKTVLLRYEPGILIKYSAYLSLTIILLLIILGSVKLIQTKPGQ